MRVSKDTRDIVRAFRDAVDAGSYDDALRELASIADSEGYWEMSEGEDGDGPKPTLATADEVADLRDRQKQLYEAMKDNREAIQALQSE